MATTQTATSILAQQADETVWAMAQILRQSPRDARGNLRELTDGELAFNAAVKAEFTARGLGRR